MKLFYIIRNQDESGISGTGKVLEGTVFDDGVTVIRWCVKDKPNSTAIYGSFEEFKFFHIDSHPTNDTEIVWAELKWNSKDTVITKDDFKSIAIDSWFEKGESGSANGAINMMTYSDLYGVVMDLAKHLGMWIEKE